MYPGGRPATHIVKLRMVGQTRILGPTAGTWGVLMFEPSNPVRPLKHLDQQGPLAGTGVNLTTGQVFLKWSDKTDDATLTNALSRRQPYGWDGWQTSSTRHYKNAVVLGSRITISFLEGVADEAATNNMLAGFVPGLFGITAEAEEPDSFATKFANIDNGEPMDALNVNMFPGKALSDPGISTTVGRATKFSYYYSKKKHQRHLRRIGKASGSFGSFDFQSEGDEEAIYNPKCFFVICDRGATPATGLDCIVSIDYTIQLSGRIISGESELPI